MSLWQSGSVSTIRGDRLAIVQRMNASARIETDWRFMPMKRPNSHTHINTHTCTKHKSTKVKHIRNCWIVRKTDAAQTTNGIVFIVFNSSRNSLLFDCGFVFIIFIQVKAADYCILLCIERNRIIISCSSGPHQFLGKMDNRTALNCSIEVDVVSQSIAHTQSIGERQPCIVIPVSAGLR